MVVVVSTASYQSYHRGIEIISPRPVSVMSWLSIVPSWNWNGISLLPGFVSLQSYQSYHRGIEMLAGVVPVGLGGLSIVPSWNWNESRLPDASFSYFLLSIVPSWNWNAGENVVYGWFACSINRTIVELKWVSSSSRLNALAYQSYHRGIEMIFQQPFNGIGQLSIVPSWNWNGNQPCFDRKRLNYQSYHRGIEIITWRGLRPFYPAINRTIVELK